MAKSQEKKNLRSKIKVWHITDFDQIFKLGDDARKGRKGPLSYTKSFVSLSGTSKPCEVHHYERLKDLKSRPERHLLRSVFEDLKSWSAHKPQRFQGYLVTHSGRPAGPDYIASQIDYIDKNELKKAMMILHQIGLIERLVKNGQFYAKNKDCPDGSGNTPDGSGDDAQSLKEGEGKDQAAPDKQKATNGLSASGCKGKDNGKGKSRKDPSRPEPSAEEPRESDLGGEASPERSGSPSGAVKPSEGRQRAAPVHQEGDYEKCDIFPARRIFEILWPRRDAQNEFGRREIGSFASKIHECRCRLWAIPPPEIDRFMVRGINEASKIAHYCERKKQKQLKEKLGLKIKSNNPGKIWNSLMTKISMAITARKSG